MLLPPKMSRTLSLDLNPIDVAVIDLGRVLDRLEKKILSTNPDPHLLHSSFERNKTAAVSVVFGFQRALRLPASKLMKQ